MIGGYFQSLLSNRRFYVLIVSVVLSLVLLFWAGYDRSGISITRLIQYYALAAVTYLYAALLIGPLAKIILRFPLRNHWLFVRRALGVSACYFALLHSTIAFFLHLGGFQGLSFLNQRYIFAITIGAISLLIVSAMAATSFDAMIKKLTFRWWKRLHQLIYLAGLLILIHAMMLGSHFQEVSALIPQLLFISVALLIFLHMHLLGKRINQRLPAIPGFVPGSLFLLVLISYVVLALTFPDSMVINLSLHKKHSGQTTMQGHLSATQQVQVAPNRFTASLTSGTTYQPNVPQTIRFKLTDTQNPHTLLLLQKIYEKEIHLVITDSTLSFYEHIHPERTGTDFSVTTTFPAKGIYYGYLNYQPFGLPELLSRVTFTVGDATEPQPSVQSVDTQLTKSIGSYQVTLLGNGVFDADAVSSMKQQLLFRVTSNQGTPVRTLKPYLGAFGHLVMIHQQTYEYIHVHPIQPITDPDASGGPSIAFVPMNLTGTITPGIYRVFLQVNPDNSLILADFTVKIE